MHGSMSTKLGHCQKESLKCCKFRLVYIEPFIAISKHQDFNVSLFKGILVQMMCML